MLSILLLAYLFRTLNLSTPLSINSLPRTLNRPEHSLPACRCPDEQRTVWEILWSCLATIFTCIWVSVHPNIPDPSDSAWKVAKRRAGLMIWAILAPELIVFWAMRQWIGARHIAHKYHGFGWTKAHAHFLQMGGFMLYESDGKNRCSVLREADLERLLKEGKIIFPSVTEEEIQDRSKGDGFTKTIALCQTTWFIGQCITRQAQGLVVTELEVVALAFASFNGLMYLFWWNKPLAVRYSVPVLLVRERQDKRSFLKVRQQQTSWDFKISTLRLVRDIYDGILNFYINISDLLSGGPAKWITGIIFSVTDFFQADKACNSPFRIPTRYAEDIGGHTRLKLGVLIAVVGDIFGAIHCVSWDSPFPTDTERIIWRVCSVMLLSAPQLLLFDTVMFFGGSLPNHIPNILPTSLIGYPTLISIILYVAARLILIVEAFITLRAPTPAALAQVGWLSFIPHI